MDSLNFIKIPSNVIYFFLGSFSMSEDRHFLSFHYFFPLSSYNSVFYIVSSSFYQIEIKYSTKRRLLRNTYERKVVNILNSQPVLFTPVYKQIAMRIQGEILLSHNKYKAFHKLTSKVIEVAAAQRLSALRA